MRGPNINWKGSGSSVMLFILVNVLILLLVQIPHVIFDVLTMYDYKGVWVCCMQRVLRKEASSFVSVRIRCE
jgi:hypothetical protein